MLFLHYYPYQKVAALVRLRAPTLEDRGLAGPCDLFPGSLVSCLCHADLWLCGLLVPIGDHTCMIMMAEEKEERAWIPPYNTNFFFGLYAPGWFLMCLIGVDFVSVLFECS